MVNFHNTVDAADLYNRVEALANHVYGQCTAEYKAKWTLWLARYYNALICPVNECKTGDYTCHANANADGIGYTCECHAGYSGKKCLPDDPCDTNNGGCHEHANCKSTIIGYDVNHVFKCKVGYYGSGKVCAPIDPCEYHNCDANAMPTPSARFNLDTVVLPSRNASVQLHTLVTDTHARSVPSARTTVQAEQPVGTENVFVHLSASTTIGAKSNAWTKTNANQAKITAPRMPTARTLTMVSLAHVKMDTLEMVSLAALLTVNTLTIV